MKHPKNRKEPFWLMMCVILPDKHHSCSELFLAKMGLGKTITCVSLMGATLNSSIAFAASPLDTISPPSSRVEKLEPDHFAGSVWGMPDTSQGSRSSTSSKAKAKAERLHDKQEAEYARHCRIKVKSRATLIICPLSTVSNWEEQFRDHWKGEVSVVGGSAGVCGSANGNTTVSQPSGSQMPIASELEGRAKHIIEGRALRIYIYHGNARRPDPSFLANFDAVITTYATLATEFSRQTRSMMPEDYDDDPHSEDVLRDNESELDERADPSTRPPKLKTNGKRKKPPACNQANNLAEMSSALQSVHWFRVVLDEAQ
jgi:SWI/SNF-related matrix-associated actin-dependent regulator of chromatin subfamily A3